MSSNIFSGPDILVVLGIAALLLGGRTPPARGSVASAMPMSTRLIQRFKSLF